MSENTNENDGDIRQKLSDAAIKDFLYEFDARLVRHVNNSEPGDYIYVCDTCIGVIESSGRLVSISGDG